MEPGLDGVMQVLEIDGDDVRVAIVNPDGSLAEMSGNGTRIVAAWLMDRTGSDVAHVHVGPLTVDVRRVGERLYESDMGDGRGRTSASASPGSTSRPVSVGNPHAVVVGDPDDLPRDRPAARDASALPEPHERPGRPGRRARRGDGARLGARRGGDDRVRLERRRRRGGDARRRRRARALSRRRPPRAPRTQAARRSPARRSRGLGADLVLAQDVVERRQQYVLPLPRLLRPVLALRRRLVRVASCRLPQSAMTATGSRIRFHAPISRLAFITSIVSFFIRPSAWRCSRPGEFGAVPAAAVIPPPPSSCGGSRHTDFSGCSPQAPRTYDIIATSPKARPSSETAARSP